MWDFLGCFRSKGLLGKGNIYLFACRKVMDLQNYENNTKKSLTGSHALN